MANEVKMTSGDLTLAQQEFVQKAVMYELDALKDNVLFKFAEKTNFTPTSDEYSWRMYKDLPETNTRSPEKLHRFEEKRCGVRC